MTNQEGNKQELSEQRKNAQKKFKGRFTSEEVNPCLKEHELSYECMNKHNYDSDKCEAYFENYKRCKRFWLSVQIDRRNKGIYPILPDAEERKKIKEEFLEKLKNNQ